jgi:hypothetical protein
MISVRQTAMSELLDSRCSICKRLDWQCSRCQTKDKATRAQRKREAAEAKIAAASSAEANIATASSQVTFTFDSSVVYVIPDDIAKMTREEVDHVLCSGPKLPSPIARRISAVPLPAKRRAAPKKQPRNETAVRSVADPIRQRLKQVLRSRNEADVPSVADPKKSLRQVLKSSPHDWKMTKVLRNGHCFFQSCVLALQKLNREGMPQSMQELRSLCSEKLREWKGIIPGGLSTDDGPLNPLNFIDGVAKVQVRRGEAEVDVSLEEYCQLLSTSLYGGSDEMTMIVQLFQVQIHLFHDESYRGGDPNPVQIFVVNPNLPLTHEVNSGNSIRSYNSNLLTVVGNICFRSKDLLALGDWTW